MKKENLQELNIFITYEAIYDIVDAEEYIAFKFGVNKALEYHSNIYNELASLKTDYNLYDSAGCVYRNYVIHKKPHPPAIIFWIVKEDGVHILRVTREEFNWQQFFETHQNHEYTYPEVTFIH